MIFSPELFAEEVFYGVYAGDQVIAAGGTHSLVPAAGFAVLGRILTTPQARGQGLATAVTTALVQALQNDGYPTIILNVFLDNEPAIKVYERVGFQKSCLFWTGKAIRKHL